MSDYFEKLEEVEAKNIPITIEYYSKDHKMIVDIFLLEWKYLGSTLLGTDPY